MGSNESPHCSPVDNNGDTHFPLKYFFFGFPKLGSTNSSAGEGQSVGRTLAGFSLARDRVYSTLLAEPCWATHSNHRNAKQTWHTRSGWPAMAQNRRPCSLRSSVEGPPELFAAQRQRILGWVFVPPQKNDEPK